MQLSFIFSRHAYESSSIFADAICHGVYIEIGDAATLAWFHED